MEKKTFQKVYYVYTVNLFRFTISPTPKENSDHYPKYIITMDQFDRFSRWSKTYQSPRFSN